MFVVISLDRSQLGFLTIGSYLCAPNTFFPVWNSKVVCPKAILLGFFGQQTFRDIFPLLPLHRPELQTTYEYLAYKRRLSEVYLLETFGLSCLVLTQRAMQ